MAPGSEERATHEPTPAVRRKAEAAGIDLDTLRQSDPTAYAVLNAQRTVQLDPALKEVAGRTLFAAFPERQLFDMPQGAPGGKTLSLLIFPPLDSDELARLDAVLAELATQVPSQYAFYRVVTDVAGERRELALPVAPGDWRGQAGVMVGPFESESAAGAWGETHVDASSGLVSDVLPYNGAWFCDLFRGNSL